MIEHHSVTVTIPTRSQSLLHRDADCRSLLESCRRIIERSLAAQERSRALQLRSITLQERSRALIERCQILNATSPDGRLHDQSTVVRPRGVDDAAPSPLPVSPTKGTAPRRSKLLHKNRWLISVDVVAALARAGVDCNILIPGGEPWLAALALDPHSRLN